MNAYVYPAPKWNFFNKSFMTAHAQNYRAVKAPWTGRLLHDNSHEVSEPLRVNPVLAPYLPSVYLPQQNYYNFDGERDSSHIYRRGKYESVAFLHLLEINLW